MLLVIISISLPQNFKVDMPVVYMVQEIVVLDDPWWEQADGDLHVLISVKWCQ